VCPDDGKSPIRVHNPPQMVTARSLMRSKKQEASLSDYFISLLTMRQNALSTKRRSLINVCQNKQDMEQLGEPGATTYSTTDLSTWVWQ
jgi:hypothetical protein